MLGPAGLSYFRDPKNGPDRGDADEFGNHSHLLR